MRHPPERKHSWRTRAHITGRTCGNRLQGTPNTAWRPAMHLARQRQLAAGACGPLTASGYVNDHRMQCLPPSSCPCVMGERLRQKACLCGRTYAWKSGTAWLLCGVHWPPVLPLACPQPLAEWQLHWRQCQPGWGRGASPPYQLWQLSTHAALTAAHPAPHRLLLTGWHCLQQATSDSSQITATVATTIACFVCCMVNSCARK